MSVERVKELLEIGMAAGQVADVLGCSASYVSQLMEDTEFMSAVHAGRIARAQNAVAIDKLIELGEEKALRKIVSSLDVPQKLSDIHRSFQLLNGAKKHVPTGMQEQRSGNSVVVNIQLPQAASVLMRFNEKKEVVEIEGRSMAALPAKHVEQMLRNRQGKDLIETSNAVEITPLAEKLFDI